MNSTNKLHSGVLLSIAFLSSGLLLLLLFRGIPPGSIAHVVIYLGAAFLCFWLTLFTLGSFKKFFPFFVVASLSVLLSLGMLEVPVLLKLVDYRLVFKTLLPEPWKNPLNDSDPTLLHIHRPNFHYLGVQGAGDIAPYRKLEFTREYPFSVKTDSLGFRNNQEFSEADIVVIGDSFIEATTVPFEQMMTTRLAELSGKKVMNLGQLWYGPQQELEVLKRYALERKPEHIIWAIFGGNDLSDFERYEQYYPNWGSTSARYHSVVERSFFKNSLITAYRMTRVPAQLPEGEVKLCPDSAGGFSPLYFLYAEGMLTDENRKSLQSVVGIIQEAAALAHSINATFSVLYIPTKRNVYAGICKDDESSPESNLASAFQAALSPFEDVAFLDLSPALRAAALAGKATYFPDDTHWTSEGNLVAAKAALTLLTTRSSSS